jgi:hypothetical protein
MADPGDTAELSPPVTKRQFAVQASQVSGGPIPADGSRHGERRRVMMNIAQRLRSGPSNCSVSTRSDVRSS